MASLPPRRIHRVTRQYLSNKKNSPPKWEIFHYSYTDGGEVYEVHSLEGEFPPQRFRQRDQLMAWLYRRGHTI